MRRDDAGYDRWSEPLGPRVLPGLQYYNAFRLITSRLIGLNGPPCDIRRKHPEGYIFAREMNDSPPAIMR